MTHIAPSLNFTSLASGKNSGFIRGILRKTSLVAFAFLNSCTSVSEIQYRDDINCSVPEVGQPFLFDTVADVPIGNPLSLIHLQGEIEFHSFINSPPPSNSRGEGNPWIIGDCFISQANRMFKVDARPSEEAGTRSQLYKYSGPK